MPSAPTAPRRRSLTWRLWALAAGLIAPTLAFVGVLLWQVAASERGRVETQARALSHGLALALDREVNGIVTTLQALGTSPSLAEGTALDLAAFRRQADEVSRLQGLHLSLRDLGGGTLMTTRAPLGTSVARSAALQEADEAALRTRATAVSDVFTGAVTSRPTFQIVTPIPAGGEPAYLLGASLDLDYLADMLRQEGLPEGWVGAILDRKTVFVARSRDHDSYAGRPASPAFRALATGESGSYYGPNTGGTVVLAGYARSSLTGWVASANVPAEVVSAPQRRYLLALAALGLALGAIAALLAGLMRRRILGAMRRLRDAARAIEAGEAVPALATAVTEVDEVGHALATASAGLREREEARGRAEAALRDLNATLERRVAEAVAEREQAEARLRQAQKMEAVGQLTGGIAHDFNNLLTVVTGNLEMLRRRVDGADARLARYADNAAEGARRAATLTNRLLAFSRQSPLAPEPVDPNRLVAGMSDLLGRTLGEAVAVETVLAGGLWWCEADPNQMESALLNLAVNARDAMPEGGKLTIETANAYLDEAYAASTPEAIRPGQYVSVSVSDTGAGMSPEVRARVFEPFFTTKPVGKGTGLGLAQVYGFMRQSGGHAAIYSEPGQGTTVRLYFPRVRRAQDRVAPATDGVAAPVARGEGETVLVVEDEAMVRDFSVAALEEAGYRVLAAEDGPTGLALLDAHPEVALLFTDVVLAGPMNGRKVADEAVRRRPGLPVLFTTGYTRNAIVHHGRLDEGVDLISKPFTAAALGRRVRQLLDEPGRGRAA